MRRLKPEAYSRLGSRCATLLLIASGALAAPNGDAVDPITPKLCLATDTTPEEAGCGTVPFVSLARGGLASLNVEVGVGATPEAIVLWLIESGKPGSHRSITILPSARAPASNGRAFERLQAKDFLPLTGDEAGNYRPLWHPSGRYLVWHQIGELQRLWCLDATASQPRPRAIEFTAEDGDELFGGAIDSISHFEWEPHSSRLIVRLTRSKVLQRVELEGCRGEVSPATDLPAAADFAFSPNGRWLAWRPVNSERVLVGPRGGAPIGAICGDPDDVILRRAICRGIRWRPDGGQIAFWWTESGRSAGQQIAMRAIDQKRRRIGRVRGISAGATSGPGADARKPALALAYSPNGQHLGFVTNGEIHIVDTGPGGDELQSRSLSRARGRYNSNRSDIVWLDRERIAAVVDSAGSQHPIAVVNINPLRRPLIISRAFPAHNDLAWDPVNARLAVSAFDAQQGIHLAQLSAGAASNGSRTEYRITVKMPGGESATLGSEHVVYPLGGGVVLQGSWEHASETPLARLRLTFAIRED